ncbi:hypothetical protein MKW94_024987 [Papaver nudicaule]|uniref:Uncharacterized protein n=1 Tax=Papaver nudicaule TaxID=74823 RepID=A0AA42AYR3_PAPNU|nr:hypothetical protein [Papaver nudicaule]
MNKSDVFSSSMVTSNSIPAFNHKSLKSITTPMLKTWKRNLLLFYCPSACNYRCNKASRHKMCIRACNTCCQRCNCVPPGTSGNTDVCPCYAKMTTHGGRLKCP